MGTLQYQLLYSFLVLCLLIILNYLIDSKIKNTNFKYHLKQTRGIGIRKFLKATSVLLFVLALIIVWGLNPDNLWVVGSTVISFIGIGFFASWSFLSNIFAAFILFFTSPFKIGDYISFKESSEDMFGKVHDMTLVYVFIKKDEGGTICIPNNVILQRTVIKYSAKEHFQRINAKSSGEKESDGKE
ncbi:conserved hypothetical protein [Chloroherpeton thalassium ATCC 35110]|uniref:Mechanosensitive ion channel MscS domain-containing protein n=1 Tax=Chloroherpeton thalassium (strain ATCC 35110 / GB-78) TaxID=517418 RepID=B3QS27_CHLT3|nr:mechanosensitive ion channel family protein [Chloroherpeton thalassium]ACF13972.1 conserved hypothetical protein [Chloroherpeton thalassium ATCC 35110]